MEESIDIPDLDEVQDLATAKFLLKYVVKALEARTGDLLATVKSLEEPASVIAARPGSNEFLVAGERAATRRGRLDAQQQDRRGDRADSGLPRPARPGLSRTGREGRGEPAGLRSPSPGARR